MITTHSRSSRQSLMWPSLAVLQTTTSVYILTDVWYHNYLPSVVKNGRYYCSYKEAREKTGVKNQFRAGGQRRSGGGVAVWTEGRENGRTSRKNSTAGHSVALHCYQDKGSCKSKLLYGLLSWHIIFAQNSSFHSSMSDCRSCTSEQWLMPVDRSSATPIIYYSQSHYRKNNLICDDLL